MSNPRLDIRISWSSEGEYIARTEEFPDVTGHSLWPQYALSAMLRKLQELDRWHPDTRENRFDE